jgi:hypothetical protein
VTGPGATGLTVLLHGPVQAWDSGRWLAPQPVPGWMATSIGRPWPLIILPYGAPPPPQSQQGNPFDLVAGAVPGAGFILLRPLAGPGQASGVQQTTGLAQAMPTQTAQAGYGPGASGQSPAAQAGYGPGASGQSPAAQAGYGPGASGQSPAAQAGYGPGASGQSPAAQAWYGPGSGAPNQAFGGYGPQPTYGSPAAGAPSAGITDRGNPNEKQPGESPAMSASGATPLASSPGASSLETSLAAGSPTAISTAAAPISTARPAPVNGALGPSVDLRSVASPGLPSLAIASTLPNPFAPERPEALCVRCQQGHFNHPRVVNCLRCGAPVTSGTPPVNGPRPAVGVLLADDGSIWALDRGYLLGSDPSTAAEVQSGAVQAIAMRAGPDRTMAPVQAEIRSKDWAAYLVDRGAPGGTWVQSPTAQVWEPLGRSEQREVSSGSHISFGGRVLTYLSAWPA